MSLEAAKRHEAVHSGAKQILSFVNSIQQIVGSALAAYPPASFVWVGICAILPIIVSLSTQKLAMVQGLNHVMEKSEWYMVVSKLSLSFQSQVKAVAGLQDITRKKIIELFRALLGYEMKCVCSCFSRSRITSAIKSLLLDDWETQLGDIQNLESEVDKYMSQLTSSAGSMVLNSMKHDTSKIISLLDEVKALRSQMNEEYRSQVGIQRAELIGKFSDAAACPYLDRMMANPQRVHGTCDWFQNHQSFREWVRIPDGGLLLLTADPGCGKSVLSRTLVQEILPHELPEASILYFFFKDSPDQRSLSTALCALTHQLLSANPELVDNVREMVASQGAALTSKERTLWLIFAKLVTSLRRQPGDIPRDVICVLDALDECQRHDRELLVEHIYDLLERNPDVQISRKKKRLGRICFVVTTRGYPDIVKLFSEYSTSYIRLAGESKDEIDQIQVEIAKVAEYKLEQLASRRKFTDKQRAQILQSLTLKGGEQRTYLWVKLVFDVLDTNLRNYSLAWKRLISEVPQTVYDAYERLLSRVTDFERGRVVLLLHMMVAAYRPLPVSTAALLLNAREFFDDGIPQVSDDIEWETNEDFKTWVLGACGIFVTIYDDQLFFLHQTAKEFLVRPPEITTEDHTVHKSTPTSSFFKSISYKDAHRTMAQNCLSLWKYCKTPLEGDTRCKPRFTSDNYSYEFWAQHFRDSQAFTISEGSSYKVVDIHEDFWDLYLEAWQDETFIKSQDMQTFVSGHTPETSQARYTKETRLGFIASYGHYRLLEEELTSRAEKGLLDPSEGPCFLPATWVYPECASLLLRFYPLRPVLILSEPDT